MPCKSCGKDHGKFYGGYCPECLEAHNRELEASCAALVERVTMLEEQLAKRNR